MGRRWAAAAFSSAGKLPPAIPSPPPPSSAINICIISEGLLFLQYKISWWCELVLELSSSVSAYSGMILLSLVVPLLPYIHCQKKKTKPKQPTMSECKHLPVLWLTETFILLVQWAACWFLLWCLEGVKSISLPSGAWLYYLHGDSLHQVEQYVSPKEVIPSSISWIL